MTSSIAVIDFETANHQANSACQLGLVLIDNWRIVGEHEWLIRPKRMYFSANCTRVHGLTARDCMGSPEFDTIWGELQSLVEGRVLLAHNVGFDAAVLLATSQLYDIALPNTDLQCTRLIAKRAWPGLSGYGLADVAAHLGITFQHHRALEDARACAKVAIAAATKFECDSMDGLEDRLGLDRGKLWGDRIRQPRTVRRSRMEMVSDEQPRYQPRLFRSDGTPERLQRLRSSRQRADAILQASRGTKPLSGKYVVLIESILDLDHQDAVAFLSELGAIVQPQVNLQTTFIIVGATPRDASSSDRQTTPSKNSRIDQPIDASIDGGPLETTTDTTARLRHAEQRARDGQPIRILSQRQLLACLPSGLAIARGDS